MFSHVRDLKFADMNIGYHVGFPRIIDYHHDVVMAFIRRHALISVVSSKYYFRRPLVFDAEKPCPCQIRICATAPQLLALQDLTVTALVDDCNDINSNPCPHISIDTAIFDLSAEGKETLASSSEYILRVAGNAVDENTLKSLFHPY